MLGEHHLRDLHCASVSTGFNMIRSQPYSEAFRPAPCGSHRTLKGLLLAFFPLLWLAGCEGPAEQAGEKQDEAAANASGVAYEGSGPAERAGKVQDRANNAARKARQASAEALEAEGENYQRQADVEAEDLEAKAAQLRDAARDRAKALDKEAAAIDP